jgi:hypothetical protein
MSLDRAAEILIWPRAKLDPLQLSLRMQVWRVVFMLGVKAMLNGTLAREADRERDRQRVLEPRSAPGCGTAQRLRHRPRYGETLGAGEGLKFAQGFA